MEVVANADVNNDAAAQEEDKSNVNGVTPSNNDTINVDEIVSSWGEDRTKLSVLEEENFNLKRQLASAKKADDDEDDETPLSEKVEKEIARREEEKESLKQFNTQTAEREINFLEKTNPFFKANKQAVLQVAIDAKLNLTEAIKVLKARNAEAKEKINEADKDRKKGANQDTAKSGSGNVTKNTTYNKETDKGKSIAALYGEAL
jgi:hypothetical protein